MTRFEITLTPMDLHSKNKVFRRVFWTKRNFPAESTDKGALWLPSNQCANRNPKLFSSSVSFMHTNLRAKKGQKLNNSHRNDVLISARFWYTFMHRNSVLYVIFFILCLFFYCRFIWMVRKIVERMKHELISTWKN